MNSQQQQRMEENKEASTWKGAMNRSTIYDRHEARRIRTIQLQDDPRPAGIRVLSGLPGFRMVFPPYQPSSSQLPQQEHSHAGDMMTITFADSTIFSTSSSQEQMDNTTLAPSSSLSMSEYFALLASGTMIGAAWYQVRNNTARRPASVFEVARQRVPVNPPTVAAFSVASAPVPLFTATNSAAVAFLRPASFHHRHHHSFNARAMLSMIPSARSLFVVSFLAFVGYKNVLHYQKLNTTNCDSEDQ